MHVPEYGTFDMFRGPGGFCIDGITPAEFLTDYTRSFNGLGYPRSISISEFLDAHSFRPRLGHADDWIGPYIEEMLSKQPNSVFVVMSDHGNNNEGRVHPLLSLILPRWFLDAHGEVLVFLYFELQRNSNCASSLM